MAHMVSEFVGGKVFVYMAEKVFAYRADRGFEVGKAFVFEDD